MVTRSREREREYRREYRARPENRMNRHQTYCGDLPFSGVDGEGGNAPDPGALFGTRHDYYLLRAGDQTLNTGAPLTAYECLGFLSDLPKDRIYVGYFFDYDVTMMIRDLDAMSRIATMGGQSATHIKEDFDIQYIPHKYFSVRRTRDGKGPYTVVNDVGPFFQCAFVDALRDWEIGNKWEQDQIEAGKGARADFGVPDQDIDEYNALEIRLLEELMERYRKACDGAGYRPGRWQGPGWLASTMLKVHDAPKTKDIPIFDNQMFVRLANEAYYGGRFEATCVGPVQGPVYEYDINSAYPDAMRKLPCMRCGSWVQRRTEPAEGRLWFGRVEFYHDVDSVVCNLPVRDKNGGILFPTAGTGVYWSVEVEAAQRAGTQIKYLTGFEYRPGKTCTCEPYGWIAPLYDYRKSLGKDGKGKIIKLGMNSIYGKKAQSVGTPAYANAVEAGLITAYTRAKIIDAYAGHQDDLVMVATDAVYTTVPLVDLSTGEGLGQWGLKVHDEGLFVVQSGVYYSGGTAKNKTRGISEKLFAAKRDEFERAFAWLTYGFENTEYVEVQTRIFMGAKLAVAWRKPQLAGQWFQCEPGADHGKRGRKPKLCTCRKVLFNWTAKRGAALFNEGPYYKTMPKVGFYESVPYDKRIGGVPQEVRELRELRDGQPDWNLDISS